VALAVLSIRDHLAGWTVNHLAGNLLPTDIPKWVVFLILPYTFVVMTLRFAGLAFGALRGESVHEEKIG
jgi:TRAP-type C4-dicarboxylate transport system permease small subunit